MDISIDSISTLLSSVTDVEPSQIWSWILLETTKILRTTIVPWLGLPTDQSFSFTYGIYVGIIITIIMYPIIYWLSWLIYSPTLVGRWMKASFFRNLKKLPPVKSYIKSELAKFTAVASSKENENKNVKKNKGQTKDLCLPSKGKGSVEVLKMLKEMKKNDQDWYGGKTLGFVYHGSDEHTKLNVSAYELYFHSNPLHLETFPAAIRMEGEVVRMTANLLHGDSNVCGTMTSGGTESILLSLYAYRKLARSKGVKYPEVIVTELTHPAWIRGCDYFDLIPIWLKVDEEQKMPISAVRRAISSNTALIVVSACNYPNGVIDPVEEISEIAYSYNIPCHVDGCLGGFMLPFVEKLGYDIGGPWDFRNRGITSISVDTHKYAYAAKGSSVILYKNADLRILQMQAYSDWPGGLWGAPTMQGSRAGGLIAAAWASMMSLGEDGYLEAMDRAMKTAIRMREGINAIPELYVIGDPRGTVFAFAATDRSKCNVHWVADRMSETAGWHFERQQLPESLHVTTTQRHVGNEEAFLKALAEAVEYAKSNAETYSKTSKAGMYGKALAVPDRSIVDELITTVLSSYYKTDGGP